MAPTFLPARRVARRSGLPALVLATLILPTGDAGALDPQPRTYREKQKHQFRDVQLGLTHPAPHGRSTPADPSARGDLIGSADSTGPATQGNRPPADRTSQESRSQ